MKLVAPGGFSFEAGPSFDRSALRDDRAPGYAIACGGELGRIVSLAFEVGFEHYPLAREPHLVTSYYPQQSIVRVEGGGGSSFQLRLGVATR